jgi:hypothetical protein
MSQRLRLSIEEMEQASKVKTFTFLNVTVAQARL